MLLSTKLFILQKLVKFSYLLPAEGQYLLLNYCNPKIMYILTYMKSI
jgi:hypothetical protein